MKRISSARNLGVICLYIILLLGIVASSDAQKAARMYKLETLDQAPKKIPYVERYQFGQFQKGTVYLWGDRDSETLLNYSYLYSEIQFLNEKKRHTFHR